MFWYIGEIRPIVTLIISHGLLLRRHLIMRALGLDSMQLLVFFLNQLGKQNGCSNAQKRSLCGNK